MENHNPTMEQLTRRVAWVNKAAAGTVCGELKMEVLEGNTNIGEYLFLCRTTEPMRNVIHTLHGGSAAIVADQAMGSVANSMFCEDGHAPTSQLTLNFYRPLFAGDELLVKVRILNASRRLIHLSSEIYAHKAPDKLCVSASAVFFRTGKEKSV